MLETRPHNKAVTDLQFGQTHDYFVTASKDHCACVVEAEGLVVVRK